MSERNYYVLCDDNCRFPAMTKEQVLAAIEEATGVVPEGIDNAFITKIKESNHNAALTFWKGTEAEFNALDVTAQAYKVAVDASNKLYFIKGSEAVEGLISSDESIYVTETEDANGRKIVDVKTNADDYVVEQGTRYTKWASGRAECWGSSTLASGSTSRTVSASLDVGMVGNYFVNITPYLNGSIVDKIWCGSIGGNNTKSSGQFDISAITNTSSYSVGVDWRAVGYWK